jgi:vacuolar-type H+-ATPase catalytic subunit A/Vma1
MNYSAYKICQTKYDNMCPEESETRMFTIELDVFEKKLTVEVEVEAGCKYKISEIVSVLSELEDYKNFDDEEKEEACYQLVKSMNNAWENWESHNFSEPDLPLEPDFYFD